MAGTAVDDELPAPDRSATGVTGTGAPEPGSARSWRTPVLVFLGIEAVLCVVVVVSTHWLSRHAQYPIQAPLSFRGAGLFEGWVRFDGGWYREIATNGYSFADVRQQSSVAFFPAYPMAMRAVMTVTGDALLAGVLLTMACGLGVAVLFHRWCRLRFSPRVATTSLVTYLLFPYAWYLFGAVYADALFLLCVLGAFLLVERDRIVLAGLVAAVATAARPVGIGVVVGLVAVLVQQRGVVRIRYLDDVRHLGWRGAWSERHRRRRAGRPIREPGTLRVAGVVVELRRFRAADAGILLSLGGLVAWSGYLWRTWGNPLLFSEIEGAQGWDQTQTPSTWFKVPWLRELRAVPDWLGDRTAHWNDLALVATQTLQAVLVLAFVVSVLLVVRRVSWSYAVYVLAVAAIPIIGTKDWQGSGRYILAVFPAFAAIGTWLSDRPAIRNIVWGVSGALLVVLTSAYARGYYLA